MTNQYLLPIILGGCFVFLPWVAFTSSAPPPTFFQTSGAPPWVFNYRHSPCDTIKYHGYRLELTNFKILKKSKDWIRLRFTAINSGRKDVDFSKKGTEHWVQVNFDHSLFDSKLGGLRENICYALYQENFYLAAGQVKKNEDLKVPIIFPAAPKKNGETSTPVFAVRKPQQEEQPGLTTRTGSEAPLPADENWLKKNEECPDILFTHLMILEQDDKWASLEYTIENQGKGDFHLFGTGEGTEKLAIRAYISGAPVLSRGALPIGGQFVGAVDGHPSVIQPGKSITGKIRLDVRKKTRYMKSLILSLESDQFAFECNKTNNTKAVILD